MVDVILKVSALEMLLKYIASGIGAVTGPMLAPWMALRQTEAKLVEAQAKERRFLVETHEAEHGVLDIGLKGIAQRIEFQEKKRQANIASVVREAATDLGDRRVPDPDWTARFSTVFRKSHPKI